MRFGAKKIYFIMENLKFNLNDLKNKLSRLQMRDVIGGYNWVTGNFNQDICSPCPRGYRCVNNYKGLGFKYCVGENE